MQRYFIRNNQISNNTIIILDNDVHHIKNVMRMKEGSQVYVCDEDEHVYLCEIIKILEKEVILNIINKIEKKVEMDVLVTIAFGLTKREKQEEVLRRITELGASGFVNVEMERSVVKVKEVKNSKLERMNLIVKEASEQSHRSKLMKVFDVKSFKDFLEFSKEYDLKLYAYEEAGRSNNYSFKNILKDFKGKSLIVLVGPEGGISQKEVELLEKNNFQAIGLGPRILRCETAPLYVMSAISYELELGNES
jgi:16S rRNA (uracil1498-N3)-methyltransferase